MTTVVRRTPPKLPRPYPAPLVSSTVIEELREQLAVVVPEKHGAVVEQFWLRHQRRPVITKSSGAALTVTFLWRDADAEEVLLFINRMIDEWALGDSSMRRVEGTDVWWLAYRMDPDWRASYAFLPRRRDEPTLWAAGDPVRLRQALGQGRPDPGNPVSCRNRAGVRQSVVELPGARSQGWLAPREPAAPASDSVAVLTGPEDRRLWVYLPTEFVGAGLPADTPVILAFDGDVWNGRPGESTQDLPTTLQNLTADGLRPPTLAIMIDSGSRDQRWRDLDPSTGIGGYLADVLLPWVRERFGVRAARRDVIVIGQSLGGLVALSAGITYPEAIGKVVAQSASLWQDDLRGALGDRTLAGSQFCMQFGRQEWSLRRPNLVLARQLRASGAKVSVQVHNGGHDYAWWRGAVADGLMSI
ncbi:MAG: DUF3327 domain-containing protein [Microlunatus sp.]